MIDIVIPLGSGSAWDDNELRYSLRSIEKHLRNYRNIYVIGGCPGFINWGGAENSAIRHVQFTESGHASQNIMKKIKSMCSFECLSDNFLFWNDDFFLLKDIDAVTYPYYHRGDLYTSIPKNRGNWYQEYILETINELEKKGLGTTNFDCHTPIIYNKKKFIDSMLQFDFSKKVTVKSAYCNINGIEGKEIVDCKISGRMARWRLYQKIQDAHIFSTSEKCLDPYPGEEESSVKVLLRELYPIKSKYEN